MQWVAPNRTSWRPVASRIGLVGFLLGGCSSDPLTLGVASPSYLGARNMESPRTDETSADPRVNSSKVLSAIVFERVTGLQVDPARLVQP
jgi:hypothetical protein